MIVYVGPDQLIPLSGFLGTVVGIVLLFWGRVLEGYRRIFSRASSKLTAEKPIS
jgi:hypothetical protein